jgi:CubicO group peptidase (beta-lactamase class C family)
MKRNLIRILFFLPFFIVCDARAVDTSRLTAQDLEAFLGGIMPLQLEREDIAGAVISVVKDGEMIFAKGYGYADVKQKKPVLPDSTLFRPGSVSKLFIWTAVMQLVEQGKLDLDRDVNEYIDFKIPAKFGKPVTLRNIMTHTPGFEETAKDLFVGDATLLEPLGKYLPAHLPNQIFPPGETSAYSNYATSLAGYIVERVSGRKFEDYLEEFIFQPLGMQRSTFKQPLPKELLPLMSQGYGLGSEEAQSFEFVNAAPAGSLSSTASDMARFMIAHLQSGRFGDAQILRPETAKLMHSRQFALHPKTNGMALGFYEESRNGLRIIGHAGDTQYFHSDLHLILDGNVGFFISYNSGGKGEISGRDAVWEKFLDRYFPYNPPHLPTQSTAKEHAAQVSGSYEVSRREDSTILSLLYKMLQTKISAHPDGTIEIPDLKGFNGKPKKWREVEPYGYQEVNGQARIFFIQRKGNFSLAIPYPFMSFDKVTGLRTSRVVLVVLIASAGILLLAILLWPVAAAIRKHYGQKLNLTPEDRKYRLLTRFVCIVIILFLTAFSLLIVTGFEDINILSSKNDIWFRLLNGIALLGAVGTLIALYNAYRTWKNRERGRWAKVTETAIALACIGYVWILITGNLFFFNLRY